jgi:hypothetical protein
MARVAMWHVACAHICRESHLTDHEQLSRVLPRRPGVYGMFALRHDCAWRGPRPRRQGPDPQKKHRDVEEGFSAIWLHLQGWSQNALPTLKNHRHDCISTRHANFKTEGACTLFNCARIKHAWDAHGVHPKTTAHSPRHSADETRTRQHRTLARRASKRRTGGALGDSTHP